MNKLRKISLIILSILSVACDPFDTKIGKEISLYASSEIKDVAFPDTLKVMTWNIKFGGGRIDFFFDCHGNRVIMEKSEVLGHMQSLSEKIREVNPDILMIQEADVNAKRSAFIDQIQYLLDHTDLNYAAYASQWKARHIPSDGIGKMDSGNAILSKWKFIDAKRIALPLIQSQNFIVRYFYLKRNFLEIQLEQKGKTLHIVNTHLAAYAKGNTRKKQLEIIKAYADSISGKGHKLIFGGDFNSLPPYSTQTCKFDDSVCTDEGFEADDYSAETQWMVPFYENYMAAIPLDKYQNNNKDHFTHTTDKNGFWNRKLDYLFTNGRFVAGSGSTLQQWMQASDHAPIIVNYEL